MAKNEKILLLKDYIKVAQGLMSQMFFCKKHDVSYREFTKIAYVIEAELEVENKRLKEALEDANHDYAELMKERTDYVAENERLKEEARWIPVSERLPAQVEHSHCSGWVVATDKKEWTIAQFNYEYDRWEKDHSPFDLYMNAITHWKPIILPEQALKTKDGE